MNVANGYHGNNNNRYNLEMARHRIIPIVWLISTQNSHICAFLETNMKLGTQIYINNVSNIGYRTTSTDHRCDGGAT